MDVSQFLPQLNSLQAELNQLKAEQAAAAERERKVRCDYEALLNSTQTLQTDRDRLQQRVIEIEAINDKLTNMLFGRRSERRLYDSQQPLLTGFAEPAPTAEEQAVITANEEALRLSDEEIIRSLEQRRKAKRSRPRSEEIPAHIERRERVLDLSDEEKQGLTYIGDAVTERLCFEKPGVYVERIVRRKYVKTGDKSGGVIAIEPPPAVIEGGKYDASIHAAVIGLKFDLHMPTYREQDFFAMCGWTPTRSTLNELINQGGLVVPPLYHQLEACLQRDSIIHGDDTRLRLLTHGALNEVDLAALGRRLAAKRQSGSRGDDDGGHHGSINSHAWCYCGLDDGAPYNVFHWSITREHETVSQHLQAFQGTLIGDAFGGNKGIGARAGDRIGFAACNAHARRKFVEAEKAEPILVPQVLSLYRQLYDVEERGRVLGSAARHELRQRESVPLWRRLEIWLDALPADRVLPKSLFGKAVGYLRNQWNELQVYLTDGRLPIDNSLCERTIRPLAIGRANWMFLGHPQAAESRMQLLSIVSSAHRHHLVMQDYLEDVLRELSFAQQRCPEELKLDSERLLRLLPDCWAKAHPQSVHEFRREEQADRRLVNQAAHAKRRLKTT
jgi:transposase